MSKQEQLSWVELIVNSIIAWWYFNHVLRLPANADLFGAHLLRFGIGLVILAIIVSIACHIALKIIQKVAGGGEDAAGRDERDDLISLRAVRNAHFVLGAGLMLTVVQIALTELTQRRGGPVPEPATILALLGTGPLAVQHVVQMLLLAVALGTFALNASRVFYYRRGY